jgi:beta-lactamase class A
MTQFPTRLDPSRRTTSPASKSRGRPGPVIGRRAFHGFLVAALLPVRSRAAADGVEGEVRALIEGSGASAVGVAFHDLATGGEVMIRADELFHPASTMKVPVMMEVYRQAEEGTLSLDDRVTLKNEFVSIADGSTFALDPKDDSETDLYKHLGETRTVRELIGLMITVSSNLATNLLVDRVSAAKVSELTRALGAGEVRVRRGVEDGKAYTLGMNNETTARGMAVLLRRLAEREVVSKGASEAMLGVLRGQKFNEGIPAGLPEGVSIAHKTGSFAGVYHDAAVVEPAGRKPYVLVVLTRGIKDEKKAHGLVARIARAFHAHAMGRS